MNILDPGHDYELQVLDGEPGQVTRLTFVKRDTPPEKFPGNVGHYPGVIMQEVLRAFIDRTQRLRGQARQLGDTESYADDANLLWMFQRSFRILESRTRRKRGQPGLLLSCAIETYPPCPKCGHILCLDHPVWSQAP